MELRDYLRMLRRGWRTVVVLTVLFVVLAGAYLAVAPQRYEATAVLLVSPNNPVTFNDLQVGSQFAVSVSATYADVVESAQVLRASGDRLDSGETEVELESRVSATAREATALIDVTASAGDAEGAAALANSVATSATEVIPRMTGAGRGSNSTLVALEVTRAARTPTAPLSPNTSRILVLGFVVGLALGLALTIARQALDTRLWRPEDLPLLTEVPLLAVLPQPKRSQRSSILVRDDPSSPAVETFRSLRTNLSYLNSGGRRSLLFTAAAHNREGAQVPTNLAWSIAQVGRRVLLVDLDLRQSPIGEMLHLPGHVGMADVLAGQVELLDVVQKTTQAHLDVAVSGTTQPSPSDLLSGPRMEMVLALAEREYDYVVLHAPPLLSYTDAAVVSRLAGHTLVVVSAGHTRAAELTTALGALGNVRVDPLGLVLAGSRSFLGDMTKVRAIRTRTRPPAVPAFGRKPAESSGDTVRKPFRRASS